MLGRSLIMKSSALLLLLTMSVTSGCSPHPPELTVQSPSSSSAVASGTKRIARDGAGGFILPDGTRVPGDERGGFRLPNGEYVAALADGLLLPNGGQCLSDGAGRIYARDDPDYHVAYVMRNRSRRSSGLHAL